jgi:hypothetical protein
VWFPYGNRDFYGLLHICIKKSKESGERGIYRITEHKITQPCKVRPDSKVARWFVFKPKIPIWTKFQGHIWENVDIFYGHLEYFMAIWDTL